MPGNGGAFVHAPGLVPELKKAIGEDPCPGRFLITGSVSPDSLVDRVETVELLPLSQAETAGAGPPRFVERACASEFPSVAATGRRTA